MSDLPPFHWLNAPVEDWQLAMRKYIRHPVDIPISFSLGEIRETRAPERLVDVGVGGLCFCVPYRLRKGVCIHLEIPLDQSDFSADGIVVWCRPSGSSYTVGVKFDDAATCYSLRMVEQVCYICDYQSRTFEQEGRKLNLEQAAAEWIEKYAHKFPS